MPIQAVIFDWAGTVVDYGCQAPVLAIQELFRRRGVPLEANEARHAMGLLKRDQLREILALPQVAQRWRAAHGDVEKLMPFLHLPVQSGSDRILKAMNRSHSRDSYLRILDRVRAVRPDIAFSGDFIVGFPGESDADFDDTMSLVRAVGYAQAYSFKYSPRPGTPAADMADQIAPEIMDERLQRLQAQLVADQSAFNRNTVGKATEILLERTGKLAGQLIGKSPWLQSVHVLAPGLSIGDVVTVDITDSGPLSLKGEPKMRAAA
ncbi:MAG: radical SAM protein [Sphingomonadaceae bacterium]|nr:radical SAM protein [Sphingomonadaceae bacterium]